ncbi:MAG: folylpolyglutamate synthase/dihydrofolate synthase family protein [Desulfomonilaceae bacterium]
MSAPLLQNIDAKYNATIDFLYSLDRFGILLGLENIGLLLDKLGNPQKNFPVVHVAGSNGKGSTACLIHEVLREAGLKTALYTSPHLNDFRERIRLNGAMIAKEALIDSTRKVRSMYDPGRTTFFEFTTAVAFDCMAQAQPDLAVIEVGLGGRLDATNTVSPCLTVITDISREHEDYLGAGISAVAREKAGIIKYGVPLVTGATRHEARAVILETARDLRAHVSEFGRDFAGVKTGLGRFTYRSGSLTLENLYLSMPGSHQIKNATLAVAAIEQLRAQGYRISDSSVREGLRKTRFPGRFEVLRRQPDVVIDGAHTPEGMRLLKSTLKQVYPGNKPYMLLGMLRDKNYETLIEIIAPLAREVVCVPPQSDRALEPERLAERVRFRGVPATAHEDITEGFKLLLKEVSDRDVIVAAGSLYMIGPVRRACGIGDD